MAVSFSGCCAAIALAIVMAAAPVRAQAPDDGGPQIFDQQTDNPFSSLVGKRSAPARERAPSGAVERYVLTSDDRAFLFEERGARARVRFLCSPTDMRIDCVLDASGPSPEIYQLTATRGPRGDVIYKTGEGDTLLRIAAYGGATVYWPGEDHGIAASKSFGDDGELALASADYETAMRRAQSASAQVSAVAGATIFFDVSAGRRAAGATVLADAVLTAAKGLVRVADDPLGARAVADRINRVAFLPGAAPGVALNGTVLEIIYVPNLDIGGRPSSATVALYLEETL